MSKRLRQAESSEILPKLRPALTPEAREGQLIALAMDLAEQRLRDGTASAQEVTHFLRLGSTRERIEKEILERERDLKEVKRQAIESQARMEELYSQAIAAMRQYSGSTDNYVDDLLQ